MNSIYDSVFVSPALGAVKGDTQEVSVYDSKLGNRRVVITTPEEADAFVKDREDAIKKAAKKGWGLAALGTATGGAIGAAVGGALGLRDGKKLSAFVEPLNQEIQALLASGKSLFMAKSEALHNIAKDHYFDMNKYFDEGLKAFKAIDPKVIAKKAAKSGLAAGAFLAACFAVAIPFFKAQNAGNKVSQEFLEANK